MTNPFFFFPLPGRLIGELYRFKSFEIHNTTVNWVVDLNSTPSAKTGYKKKKEEQPPPPRPPPQGAPKRCFTVIVAVSGKQSQMWKLAIRVLRQLLQTSARASSSIANSSHVQEEATVIGDNGEYLKYVRACNIIPILHVSHGFVQHD